MPRVLIVCPCFHPSIGGVEKSAGILADLLSRAGYQIEVLTCRHSGRRSGYWRGVRIREHSGYAGQTFRWNIYKRELRSRIEQGGYDACIVFADPENYTWWGLERVTIPSQTRVVIVPMINDEGYGRWSSNRAFATRAAMVLANPSLSVVTHTRTAQDARFCVHAGVMPVCIPNTVISPPSQSSFREQWNIPESTFLIVHVANLWPVKNHDGLLSTLSTAPDLDVTLMLIGRPGPDSGYVDKVRRMVGKDHRCILLEDLDDRDMASVYTAADLVLLSSHGEVSPLVILEAMAHGKPWLATPSCGAVHEHAGGLIAPLDTFPQRIAQLQQRPGLRGDLGAAGKEHAASAYAPEKIGEAWRELLETGKMSIDFSAPSRSWNLTFSTRRELDAASGERPLEPVSFCIITNGKRPDGLKLQIASIHRQGLLDYEILIAGDVPIGLDRVKAIPMPKQARNGLLGVMRNALVREARHEFMVVLDDDILLQPDFIRQAARDRGSYDVMTTRIYNPDGSRHWDWATGSRSSADHHLIAYGRTGSEAYISGAVCITRREVARAIQWNEQLGFYQEEDVDFSHRAKSFGYRIGCCHRAAAIHMDARYTLHGRSVIRFVELPFVRFMHLMLTLLIAGHGTRALRAGMIWGRRRRMHGVEIASWTGLVVLQKLISLHRLWNRPPKSGVVEADKQ